MNDDLFLRYTGKNIKPFNERSYYNEPSYEIRLNFDPAERLRETMRDLELRLPKEPMFSIFILGDEKARAYDRYFRTLDEIEAVKQWFMADLERARMAKVISERKYFDALSDLNSPFGPFRELRRRTEERFAKQL